MRERARRARITALQFLLALGCALVLLFPVISATDDLHAMRAEMEESATSKRAVRQAGGEKHAAWVNRLQGPPALLANMIGCPLHKPGRSKFLFYIWRRWRRLAVGMPGARRLIPSSGSSQNHP